MTTINELAEAIQNHKKVLLQYDDQPPPLREIDPYVIYRSTTGKILLNAYQHSGYSESEEEVAWKIFEIDRITSLTVLDKVFDIRPDYKPDSDRYSDALYKVQL